MAPRGGTSIRKQSGCQGGTRTTALKKHGCPGGYRDTFCPQAKWLPKLAKQAWQRCVPLPLATGGGSLQGRLAGAGPCRGCSLPARKVHLDEASNRRPPRPQHTATRTEGHFGSGMCRGQNSALAAAASAGVHPALPTPTPSAVCPPSASLWRLSTVRADQREDGRLREARGWRGQAVSLL